MPKTKNAFALRDFDFDKFIRDKLLVCGLSPNALISMDADKNNFADMQRARKAYQKLDEELKNFRSRLTRHNERYQRYGRLITEKVASLDDDDYYFSVLKPKSKRMMILSDKYTAIAVKILEFEDNIKGIIYNLDQYQRGYYAKIFAMRLREARKAAGLTQNELAEKLGVKRGTYNAYETARNEPNISVLALVAREFNRPLNWFLGL
ncbi:MAG: helix-turn-helix transcriptional regulator [Selenomonadaceae bacterium]|nr:helix-turn-helix transcriptional regulator [Selenomonadaceae bacterium]